MLTYLGSNAKFNFYESFDRYYGGRSWIKEERFGGLCSTSSREEVEVSLGIMLVAED